MGTLYGVGWNNSDDNVTIYKICDDLTEVKTLAAGQDLSDAVMMGDVLYGMVRELNGKSLQISSFDFKTDTYAVIADIQNVTCLTVADSSLYAILPDNQAVLIVGNGIGENFQAVAARMPSPNAFYNVNLPANSYSWVYDNAQDVMYGIDETEAGINVTLDIVCYDCRRARLSTVIKNAPVGQLILVAH